MSDLSDFFPMADCTIDQEARFLGLHSAPQRKQFFFQSKVFKGRLDLVVRLYSKLELWVSPVFISVRDSEKQ